MAVFLNLYFVINLESAEGHFLERYRDGHSESYWAGR
jgi:hypothetical protein